MSVLEIAARAHLVSLALTTRNALFYAFLAFVLFSIAVVPRSVSASTLSIIASSDANITNGALNTYAPGTYGLVVNTSSGTVPVMEFNLATLPTNVVIDSMTFAFYVTSVTSSSNPFSIMGFLDSGVITSTAATRSATNLGGYNPQTLGQQSVTLSTSFLQSHLGSSYLAVRLESSGGFVNTSIGSLENQGFSKPTLGISFHIVPEPAVAHLAVFIPFSLIRMRRAKKRRHSTIRKK
jgi:hypothetical protein